MQLVLLRHGRATGIDDDSRLTDRGRDDVRSTCTQLTRLQLPLSRLIHSGLLRARETAGIAAEVLRIATFDADSRFLPDRDPSVAADLLDQSESPLMIVSHQPLITELTNILLAPAGKSAAVSFSTSTAAVLERDGSGWRLACVLQPEKR